MSWCFDQELMDRYVKAFIRYEIATTGVNPIDSLNGTNIRLASQEGWKNDLYDKWHDCLMNGGDYYQLISLALSNTGKLVDYHELNKQLNDSDPKEIGAALESLYQNDDDKSSFYKCLDSFPHKFDLIAFLFFMKDKEHYLPIHSKTFDEIFRKIHIENSHLSGNITWDTYNWFLNCISEIREYLVVYVNTEFTLLDAHSFAWRLGKYEEYLDDKYEIVKHKKYGLGVKLPSQKETKDITVQIKGKKKTFLEKTVSEGLLSIIPLEIAADDKSIITDDDLKLTGEDRDAIIKIRINQSVFRRMLMARYGKCCLCGLKNKDLLIASHIKPWCASSKEERLDVDNGFLFCANHDKLFDKGLISFDDDGIVMISTELSHEDAALTHIEDGQHIDIREGNKVYLHYHRKYVFRNKE